MAYNPIVHHRKSIRLKDYDYSQAGRYYVTIVTQGRECVFGEIAVGEVALNEAGRMVMKWWNELPNKFPTITLGEFVVMPNHFHGIIIIHENVGADLRVCPGERTATGAGEQIDSGAHTGAPLPRPRTPLSQIVQWFKTMTTNEYLRGVKQFKWPPFEGKLWQRNYYEHIIRNQRDYERIAHYMAVNPAKWDTDTENPQITQSFGRETIRP